MPAYGVLIEVLQALTPDRSAEALDVLADAVGLLLSQAVVGGVIALGAWRG